MRLVSRIERSGSNLGMIPFDAYHPAEKDAPGVSAFRGLLVAATMSALFWGLCLTAIWLWRSRG